MGAERNISFDSFPQQSKDLGKTVNVCFHYMTDHKIKGKIIRSDSEHPYKTIIKLEDGRIVLATECQYSLFN